METRNEIPEQGKKRRLFFDMDGVLVDFESGLRKLTAKELTAFNNSLIQ